MKKKSKARTKAIITTVIAALPLTRAPALHAQRPTPGAVATGAERVQLPHVLLKWGDRYIKMGSAYDVVGMDNGNTIYRNAKNEYFYLDPATGDMKFLAVDIFIKFREPAAREASTAPLRMIKWNPMKFGGRVTILGVDADGHVIQQNARGEKFYLQPNTGDFVFVK